MPASSTEKAVREGLAWRMYQMILEQPALRDPMTKRAADDGLLPIDVWADAAFQLADAFERAANRG